MPSLMAKLGRWLSPLDGWEERYKAFLGGKKTWEVPGKPDKPQVIPFPVEWIPHEMNDLEGDDEARGFRFIDVICADCGDASPIGQAVLCLRCGVSLDPKCANMYGGFDPPYCNPCKPSVRKV